MLHLSFFFFYIAGAIGVLASVFHAPELTPPLVIYTWFNMIFSIGFKHGGGTMGDYENLFLRLRHPLAALLAKYFLLPFSGLIVITPAAAQKGDELFVGGKGIIVSRYAKAARLHQEKREKFFSTGQVALVKEESSEPKS